MAVRSLKLSVFPDTNEWSKFFEEAGLPASIAADYGAIFYCNRIKYDYLRELNESHLRDMGVEKVGDIIAILRHSKSVLGSGLFLSETVIKEEPVTLKKVDNRGVAVKKSCGKTVSSAIVPADSYSSSEDSDEEEIPVPVLEKKNSLKRKLGVQKNVEPSKSEVQVPSISLSSTVTSAPRMLKKVRRVVPPETLERKYAVHQVDTLRKGEVTVKKKNIYSRLGDKQPSSSSEVLPEPSITVTDHFGFVRKNKRKKMIQTVFSRLGSRTVVESPVTSAADSVNDTMNDDGMVGDEQDEDEYNERDVEDNNFLDGSDDEDDEEESEEEEANEDDFRRMVIVNEEERNRDIRLKEQQIRYRAKQHSLPPSKTKSALPYMGILKTSKKKAVEPKTKNMTTMRADEEQRSLHLKKVIGKKIVKPMIKKQIVKTSSKLHGSQSSDGIFSNSTRVINNNVKERLGKTSAITIKNLNRPIAMKLTSSRPTQDKSIGSTTTPRKERKPIVYDLSDGEDTDNRMMARKSRFFDSLNSTSAPSYGLSAKKVTFSGEPEINYFATAKRVSNPVQNQQNYNVKGSIALRTGVFQRLGGSNL